MALAYYDTPHVHRPELAEALERGDDVDKFALVSSSSWHTHVDWFVDGDVWMSEFSPNLGPDVLEDLGTRGVFDITGVD